MDPLVVKVLRVIEVHWTLSCSELARQLGVSKRQLRRRFRRQLGMSPQACFRRRRMEEAMRLLVDTDEPISTIGYALGFGDPAYFSRCFRKAFSISPREYRQRARLGHFPLPPQD